MKKTFLLHICLVFLSSSAIAEMYKWVDDTGSTHYTQQPAPEGIDSVEIKPRASIDSSEALENIGKQKEYLDTEREKRQKDKNDKELAAKEKADKEEKCKLAKARLNSYTAQPSVQFVQEDGSRIRATEEQRQNEITKSREMIKDFCD